MKSIITLLGLFILGSGAANAQCVPDPQFTQPGIHPVLSSISTTIVVGTSFTQDLTVVIPADTTIFGQTFTIDSARLSDVLNVPQGMGYSCDVSDCTWDGGTAGCARISGVPTQIGDYNLIIQAEFFLDGLGSTTITDTLEVSVVQQTAVPELNPESVAIYPNPAQEQLTIQLKDAFQFGRAEVMNVMGAQVKEVLLNNGTNVLSLNGLTSGVYFVKLTTDQGYWLEKLIVE